MNLVAKIDRLFLFGGGLSEVRAGDSYTRQVCKSDEPSSIPFGKDGL